jgi:hypothetical protein
MPSVYTHWHPPHQLDVVLLGSQVAACMLSGLSFFVPRAYVIHCIRAGHASRLALVLCTRLAVLCQLRLLGCHMCHRQDAGRGGQCTLFATSITV